MAVLISVGKQVSMLSSGSPEVSWQTGGSQPTWNKQAIADEQLESASGTIPSAADKILSSLKQTRF